MRQEHKLELLFKVAEIKRATFYYHLSRSNYADKYSSIKEKIIEIHNKNKGRYGYRRITMSLRNEGYVINHKTVQKLMKELGVECRVRVKKYRSYRGEHGKAAPNILQRNFSASRANEKWVTDVTEFSLFGQKLYLSPILDCFNSEIISYTIAERPNLGQVIKMLDIACDRYDSVEGVTLHSDQGWQYQHKNYRSKLKENKIVQSMSRKGNCLDNAVIENFFGLLKSELLYLQDFEDINHFKKELEEYIRWYNEDRIKDKLKGLSPINYRRQSFLVA